MPAQPSKPLTHLPSCLPWHPSPRGAGASEPPHLVLPLRDLLLLGLPGVGGQLRREVRQAPLLSVDLASSGVKRRDNPYSLTESEYQGESASPASPAQPAHLRAHFVSLHRSMGCPMAIGNRRIAIFKYQTKFRGRASTFVSAVETLIFQRRFDRCR